VTQPAAGRVAPWVAEKVVDQALARELIAAQFPALAALPLQPFGEGFDNTAHLLGGRWVFRFPRRQIAVRLMDIECAVLPKIAPRLPLPIPVPEFIGKPSEKYEWPFAGYALIAGVTAERFGLDDAQRAALARPLGAFLRALHGIGEAEAASFGAGPDVIGKLDVPLRVRRTHEVLEKLRPHGVLPPGLEQAVRRVLEQQPALPPLEPGAGVLLHGDVYARHLLLDERGALSGVIDWGDVHYGRRATDLGGALAFVSEASRDAFFEAYGGVDEATLRLSRFRAVSHQLWVAIYAAEQQDEALLRETVGGLVRATS